MLFLITFLEDMPLFTKNFPSYLEMLRHSPWDQTGSSVLIEVKDVSPYCNALLLGVVYRGGRFLSFACLLLESLWNPGMLDFSKLSRKYICFPSASEVSKLSIILRQTLQLNLSSGVQQPFSEVTLNQIIFNFAE